MLITRSVVALAVLCVAASAAQAQVMPNGTANNPTAQGYATSGAAAKDQKSTGPHKSAHKRMSQKSINASATALMPRGTSAAETAGASSPAGSPQMKKDDGRLNPH